MTSATGKDGQQGTLSYSDKRTPYYPPLPAFEVVVYFILWVVIHGVTFYPLLRISDENALKYLQKGDVEPGWYGGRYKDTTDFEWEFWNKYLWPVHVIGSLGHFVIARMADILCPQHRFKVFALYGCAFTVYFLGWIGLIFILGHFVVQYAVTVATRSIAACWICALLLMYSLDSSSLLDFMEGFYADKDRGSFLLFATAMCGLRYLSFSIEYVWISKSNFESMTKEDTAQRHPLPKGTLRRRKKNAVITEEDETSQSADPIRQLPDFLDLLVYQMYFPLLYGGPVMTYDEFTKQVHRPPLTWTFGVTARFVLGMMRYIFWHFVVDITFHYVYFSTMPYDSETVAKMSTVELFGLAWYQTYFFVVKYIVMYGIASQFSTSDNMVVDGIPHCPGAKHSMTDMWRYFDKGLHRWLLRYIFLPLGGSRDVSFLRVIVNSFLPFAFVWFWHGTTPSILTWAVLNWFGVYIEGVAYRIYKMKPVRDFEVMYLGPSWSRRIRGLLSTPTYALMITCGLFFPLEQEVAILFWERLYFQDVFVTIIMYLSMYPGVQTSMEFRRRGIGF